MLLAVYVIGTSMDGGPDRLSRKVTFRLRYRTVLFAVVVFDGEAGTLMTIARQKTNWAAHLYVYIAILALGVATLYLALTGIERAESVQKNDSGSRGEESR